MRLDRTATGKARAWSLEQRVRDLARNRARRDHRLRTRTRPLDEAKIEGGGFRSVDPEQEVGLLNAELRALLTPEQRRVYDLLLQGFRNAEIADQLEVSKSTVKRRKAAIRSLIEKILNENEVG